MARLAVLALVGAVAMASCGGSDDEAVESTEPVGDPPATEPASSGPVAREPATTEPDTTEVTDETTLPSTEAEPVATEAAADPGPDLGRVVVLSEEYLLSDVLSLGIEPIASTVSVEEAGIQGIEEYDTSGIEVLPMTTLSLEYLASLEPDTIIALQFWVDQVGEEVLAGMGDLVIVPDALGNREQMATLGELLGREEQAAANIAQFDAAIEEATTTVGDDCVLSLAAIYSGPNVAAFVAGPWEIPTSILSTGCVLDPGPDVAEPDNNGRVWLSNEQLGILDAPTIVLLQSEAVEGESDAVADIMANPLWTALPAVQSDDVVVFDRLGYPGMDGQIRFLGDFSTAFAS
jgi:iron complex transport system substrate-binding protein